MRFYTAAFFFAAIAAFALAQTEEAPAKAKPSADPECPQPVTCIIDPCTLATCPGFPTATCVADNCNGDCGVNFFRGERDVTERCSCEFRKCGRNRVCVEEPFPCRENQRNCQGRITTSCMRIPEPLPPTNCSQVLCDNGKVCEVVEMPRGPVAKCMEVIPMSCEDIECGPRMQCRERVSNKDGSVIVRCIAASREDEEPARDCSEIQCREGYVCMLVGNSRPKCGKPPVPTNCKDLECDPGYKCEQVPNSRRVRCAPLLAAIEKPQTCADLDCEEGFACKRVVRDGSANRYVPQCIQQECPRVLMMPRPRPPQNCRQLRCGREEFCVECREGEEMRPRARCVPRDMRPMMNRTRPRPPMNATRPPPPMNSTRPRPPMNTTRPRPPMNSTRPRPPMNSTRPRPPMNVTRPPPQMNTTRPRPPMNTTRPPPPMNGMRPRPPTNGTRFRVRPVSCQQRRCPRGTECLQLRREGNVTSRCVPDEFDMMQCRRPQRPEEDDDEEEETKIEKEEEEEEEEDEDDSEEESEIEKKKGDEEEDEEDEDDSEEESEIEKEKDDDDEEEEEEGGPFDRLISGRFPSSCAQRRCCEGLECFERTLELEEKNISFAFCAPASFDGERPPPPPGRRAPLCDRLECGRGFRCMNARNGNGSRFGRCVRRGNETMPTRRPMGTGMRPRPTRPGMRTRPTMRPTGSGMSPKPRSRMRTSPTTPPTRPGMRTIPTRQPPPTMGSRPTAPGMGSRPPTGSRMGPMPTRGGPRG